MAKELTKYLTEKETRGIDVLKKVGRVTQSREDEYKTFIFNDVEYKIRDIMIDRDSKGYTVYYNPDDIMNKLI